MSARDEDEDQDLTLLGEVLRADAAARAAGADGDPARDAALAAFRTARDAGLHASAEPRPADDWRPRAPRRRIAGWRLAGVGAAFAGLALGGVAVAKIGAPPVRDKGPQAGQQASSQAPESPRQGHSSGARTPEAKDRAGNGEPKGPAHASQPPKARRTEALCRAYEKVGGKALAAAAWRELTAEAGGVHAVDAYCAARQDKEKNDGGKQEENPGRGN